MGRRNYPKYAHKWSVRGTGKVEQRPWHYCQCPKDRGWGYGQCYLPKNPIRPIKMEEKRKLSREGAFV